MLQLLLYSVGFYQEFGAQLQEWGITAIEPVIYKLREMSTTGVFYKSPDQLQLHLHDFYDNPILQDYLPLMRLRINELFDPKLPFKQDTVYDRQCSYCHFADFCRR